jgi:hypothetical protein
MHLRLDFGQQNDHNNANILNAEHAEAQEDDNESHHNTEQYEEFNV